MAIRESLVRYYQWLRRYGLNDSHSGNISARVGSDIWITPTGACADTLSPGDFLSCALAQSPVPGASGDAALHSAIYRQNTEAKAVIHAHCPHAIALTLDGKDFLPPDFEGQLYFPVVPVITVAYATYFDDAAALVAEQLRTHSLCIVRGHGAYARGESLDQAYKWICSLELSAKTALLAKQAGTL